MSTVLIIGATSAVASEIAFRYAAEGKYLYLLARSEDKLQRLIDALRLRGANLRGSAALDFTDQQKNKAAVEQAIASCSDLDIVVIAHGYLGDQLKSESDYVEASAQIEVNYLSVVAQLIPLSNYFEARGRGTIGVLSSVAGDRGRPRNYTYGSAKGALTLYLQGLRSRLWPHVQVTTIKLGPVDSPMTENHEKNAVFTTPAHAARAIVQALRLGKAEVYVPGYWWVIMQAVKCMPEFLFQKFSFLSGR